MQTMTLWKWNPSFEVSLSTRVAHYRTTAPSSCQPNRTLQMIETMLVLVIKEIIRKSWQLLMAERKLICGLFRLDKYSKQWYRRACLVNIWENGGHHLNDMTHHFAARRHIRWRTSRTKRWCTTFYKNVTHHVNNGSMVAKVGDYLNPNFQKGDSPCKQFNGRMVVTNPMAGWLLKWMNIDYLKKTSPVPNLSFQGFHSLPVF